jgi:AraC-like DNA-binding protein
MAPPRVIWAQLQHFPSGWRMDRHHHDDRDELVLVLHGQLRTTLDTPRALGRGMAMIHPLGRVHDHALSGSSPMAILYCAFSGCPALPSERLVLEDRDGRVESAMRWMIDAGAEGSRAGRAAADALLAAILHAFAAPRDGGDGDLARRVREHVRERLDQRLTLVDLARACGLSRAYFSRRFRAATGEAPMRWLRDLRLATARHLLATTELTVEAVARQVGFGDRYQFSRMMRRRSGRPPSAWRARR